MPERRRFNFWESRLALVVIGLALGFAARWVGGWLFQDTDPPHFKPMPEASAKEDPAAKTE